MDAITGIGLAITIALFAYLLVALLRAEEL